jgi:lipoyl(octanoyl) transferase
MWLFLVVACAAFRPSWSWIDQNVPLLRQRSKRTRHGRLDHDMIAPQQLGSFEPLVSTGVSRRRVCRLKDWTAGHIERTVDFTTAWNVQKQLLKEHIDRLNERANDDAGADRQTIDTVIFLEHDPVYTLGTGSDASFVKQQSDASMVPVIRMDRGGEVTYHGPGQLTVYPVLNLRNYKQDIHWYVRALEEVVILALQECGLDSAQRQADVTGVWVDNHKVAAIGVSCKKWITQHGVAINVTPESLPNFEDIVPCGLVGCRVGCVNQFLPSEHHVTIGQMATYVKLAMEEVFQIQLTEAPNDSTGC